MAALLLAISTAAAIQAGDIARCDMVEINHYYADGQYRWTQAIAWDWSPQYARHDAQQWVMIEGYRVVPGGVVLTTASGDAIHVRCGRLRQTWTEKDPEVENQKLFPTKERRRVW
jgi:hypothetical protein